MRRKSSISDKHKPWSLLIKHTSDRSEFGRDNAYKTYANDLRKNIEENSLPKMIKEIYEFLEKWGEYMTLREEKKKNIWLD